MDEKYKLTKLNDDINCLVKYAWTRGNKKSVIDYACVTEECYDKFVNIRTDEEQEKIGLSCITQL